MRVKGCERMGRPKGSKNVVRAKSDYKPEYAGMLLEFFRHYSEGEEAGVPTLQRFAQSIGTYTDACCTWVREHEDFAKAFVESMRIQERMLINGGLTRVFDPSFAKFLLSANHGYREKDEKASVEVTSGAGTLNVIVSRKEEKK